MTSGQGPAGRARALSWVLAVIAVVILLVAPSTQIASATETQGASADGSVRLTATPLLDGVVRPGDWLAIRVHAENDGPAVRGELRVQSTEAGSTRFALPVELATGARQDHALYAQTDWFGGRWSVELVEDGEAVASVPVRIQAADPETPVIAVIAERQERIVADLRRAMTRRAAQEGSSPARLVTMTPADLPAQADAWGSVDAIVWQDMPTTSLDPDQLEALRTWLTLGGSLVIVGGSAGPSTLEGLPDELLPFRPDRTIDVTGTELAALMDAVPPGFTTLPALAGPLERGIAIAGGPDRVIAARRPVGRGSVTIVGVDPGATPLAGTDAASSLWLGAIPPGLVRARLRSTDDSGFLDQALQALPTLDPPPIDQLVVLFLIYLLLLGPVSYLVLRRLDRREWAWITIPVQAVVFTGAAVGVGVAAKGTEIIIRELGVVQGAVGADRGVADVAVGIIAPSRMTLDVHVPGGALIGRRIGGEPGPERTDVVLGPEGGLRGLAVGGAAVPGFRVRTIVATPRIEGDVRLAGDRLLGTLTNVSDRPLQQATLVWGSGQQALGDLGPGQTVEVDLSTGATRTRRSLAERLFTTEPGPGRDERRTALARLAIVRALSGGWNWDPASIEDPLGTDGPMLLGWGAGGVLETDVGGGSRTMGETLFLLPVAFTVDGPVSFEGSTLPRGELRFEAADGWEEGGTMVLRQGTLTTSYRPAGLEGDLAPSELLLRLGEGHGPLATTPEDAAFLPLALQPDPADPMGTGPERDEADLVLPRVQLFDRSAGTWVELERLDSGRTYRIPGPERYVDRSGGFQVRFVSRVPGIVQFVLDARLTGTAS